MRRRRGFTFAALSFLKAAATGGVYLEPAACRGSLLAGLSMTVSHGAGILSYLHVNYTTAMIFKSAKVPSVVIAGRWIKSHLQPLPHEMTWAICMMTLVLGASIELPCSSFGGKWV